eukprot:scaffold1753_cov153-Amphora_coffeaeformis.AAC.2
MYLRTVVGGTTSNVDVVRLVAVCGTLKTAGRFSHNSNREIVQRRVWGKLETTTRSDVVRRFVVISRADLHGQGGCPIPF